MKINKNISPASIVLIVLLLAALACNIPTGLTNTGSPVICGDNPLPVVTQPLVVVLSGLPTVNNGRWNRLPLPNRGNNFGG
jgi:hypothetical protein